MDRLFSCTVLSIYTAVWSTLIISNIITYHYHQLNCLCVFQCCFCRFWLVKICWNWGWVLIYIRCNSFTDGDIKAVSGASYTCQAQRDRWGGQAGCKKISLIVQRLLKPTPSSQDTLKCIDCIFVILSSEKRTNQCLCAINDIFCSTLGLLGCFFGLGKLQMFLKVLIPASMNGLHLET